MKIIKHRLNQIDQIKNCSKHFGVEIDIRSYFNKLILHHDPFKKGEDFEEWLKFYDHKFLILNVKEDGLETRIIKILKENNITSYFFLDQPFPTFKRCLESNIPVSIRISEYESNINIYKMSKVPRFIWMDSFDVFDINNYEENLIYSTKNNLCIVSPELQGRDKLEIFEIRKIILENRLKIWGVCTKWPELWMD